MFIYPRGDFNVAEMNIIDTAYYIGCNGSSYMFRRNAIPQHGFEPSISMVSDWLFVIETLRKGGVVFINEALARYRRHEASMSNFPDLVFREHMQTLFLLEGKYEDMRIDVSRFTKQYVLQYAVGSNSTAKVVKSIIKQLVKRMAKQMNIRIGVSM